MYKRTQNDNGSYDTRCLHCFMTIASCVKTKRDLEILEAWHICPEKALAEQLAQKKAIVARAALN